MPSCYLDFSEEILYQVLRTSVNTFFARARTFLESVARPWRRACTGQLLVVGPEVHLNGTSQQAIREISGLRRNDRRKKYAHL